MQQTISEEEIARLKKMTMCEERLYSEGFLKIAGVDEAGRGPLAGPVVAAACILPPGTMLEGLNDSKQLSSEQRESLFHQIVNLKGVLYGVGQASVLEIDRYNILKATFLAMRRAVLSLPETADYLLIDGNQIPRFEIPTEAVVKGDARSISIAAASILAKVTRDQIMEKLDAKWPLYGFKRNKGYATEEHMSAIEVHGPSPIHRRSFDPVKSMLSSSQLVFELN